MADEQLIALAIAHGGDELMDFDNCVGVALDAVALRSLLQAVADASYERAAKEAHVDQRRDQSYFACVPLDELKGTLPEMESSNG